MLSAPSFDLKLFLPLPLYIKSCKIQRKFLQLIFLWRITKSHSFLYYIYCFHFPQLNFPSHSISGKHFHHFLHIFIFKFPVSDIFPYLGSLFVSRLWSLSRQLYPNIFILLLYCRTTPSETQNLPHLIDLLYLCHITYTTPYVRIYHHNLLL